MSKKIRVSIPTVRSILNELIEEKLVLITGIGDSSGGRKPVLYSLSGDAFFILAVEMDQYKAKAVIIDSLNELRSEVIEFETNINDPEFIPKLDQAFQNLLKASGIEQASVGAIGICMPGLIDPQNGINQTIKDQERQPVAELVSKHFNVKTYIENDARMQTQGEFVFGKARNTKNTMVVNWSWGLGLGMIFNGDIYQGSNGCSGEFSHIRMVENGELCECGKRGCLQTIAGAKHLLDIAKQEIGKGTISQLTNEFTEQTDKLTIADIINCAQKGDELAINLINTISKNVAWGLSILIQLYNPELILLNGPLTIPKQYILITIQQALQQYCLENILSNVRIEISESAANSGLRGTAVMVFNKLFSSEVSN
ncbi:ROK family protein [Mangrovibacterium lignilyticum]|uniref:ROK family protein n=1 Tax=Mangrovibacterium lignilyticum TaxID=2668052 RepID=UPI0013D53502|nr:ROK family protein [Mangrovibacterium lignilyticum]